MLSMRLETTIVEVNIMAKNHYRSIRLRNNAGMDFPVCYSRADILDTEKGNLKTTCELSKVTCMNCKRIVGKYGKNNL